MLDVAAAILPRKLTLALLYLLVFGGMQMRDERA
jgi:hypothetical protein